nr:MAG TPA: hypothetical protein [Caudoviricetes sp.]
MLPLYPLPDKPVKPGLATTLRNHSNKRLQHLLLLI